MTTQFVEISWGAVREAVKYEYLVKENGEAIKKGDTEDLWIQISSANFALGKAYSVQVRAVYNNGEFSDYGLMDFTGNLFRR